jgi:ubiquinone/menaquinone biosynthesis C-methylase UbiE
MNDVETAKLYDAMAREYDDIKDLWYSWLFSRLHLLILEFLRKEFRQPGRRCLDVGAGTGFQSIVLALCGHQVTGIDISSELLKVAASKRVNDYTRQDLFESPYAFVQSYSCRIRALAAILCGEGPLGNVRYDVASATDLPFEDNSFDLVNCCGSTLSSIEEYKKALDEMVRVLRPGGLIVLEVENRYSFDLFWQLLDSALAGKLGYDQELKVSLSNLFSHPANHVSTDFPFSTHDEEVTMPIILFSRRTLFRELRSRGIVIEEYHSVHNLTNIIPSVALDRVDPPAWLRGLFRVLSKLEAMTCSLPVFRGFGCSLVIFGRKT